MNRACAIALMVVAATTLLSFACFSGCARKTVIHPSEDQIVMDRVEISPLALPRN